VIISFPGFVLGFVGFNIGAGSGLWICPVLPEGQWSVLIKFQKARGWARSVYRHVMAPQFVRTFRLLYAVPGDFILRRATPAMSGMRHFSPMSQFDSAEVFPSSHNSIILPKTSERCSFSAPDSPSYTRWHKCSVTAC